MSVPARTLAPAGRRLRLVRRSRRKSRRNLIRRHPARRTLTLMVATAVMLVAAVFFVLLEQVVLAQSAFKLAQLRDELAAQRAQHEELLLEAAMLESPARIETYARQRLGMVDPDPAAIEYIVADIPLRARGSAAVAGRWPTTAAAAGASPQAP